MTDRGRDLLKILREEMWKQNDIFRSHRTAANTPLAPPIAQTHGKDASSIRKLAESVAGLFIPPYGPLATIPLFYTNPASHFPDPTWRGVYHGTERCICINEAFLNTNPPYDKIVDTVKHELVHAYLHQTGYSKPFDHDEKFKAVADFVGCTVYYE